MNTVASVLGVVAGSAVMAACVLADSMVDRAASASLTPAATVPRLVWQPVTASAIGAVSDFALVAGRLFVLDGTASRVAVLEEEADGSWREADTFGRPGDGPGELRDPTSIVALRTGGVAVAERQGRIHYFAPDGTFVRAVQPALPCNLSFAQLAAGADSSLFLAGNCLGGAARDTLFAVLAWSRDGLEFEEIAREPRLAVDGSWGTIYAPRRSVSEGTHEVLFGVGVSPCVTRVHAQAPPVATRLCGMAAAALSAPPPPGFREQLQQDRQRGRSIGVAYDWPDPLPTYFDKVATSQGPVLLRPYHADSLFLELARLPADSAPPATASPIVIGSLHHLVGCARDGCLWYDADASAARLSLLTIGAIDALVSAHRAGVDDQPGPSR